MNPEFREVIAAVVAGASLGEDQVTRAFGLVMDGEASPAQVAALLVALRMRGETVTELVGAARAMRARAAPFCAPEGTVLDTCGTGGDGSGSVNVSTLAALVLASCGVPVAKHGNYAQSSRSGSADLLQALGVEIAMAPARAERCLQELGFAFLLAPTFHPATRQVAAVRRELGVRTIFNLLGPLTNPAGVRHHVVGVFSREWVEPLCRALGALGAERALVVHGRALSQGQELGLDELSPTGETWVAEWCGGALRRYELRPEHFGLRPARSIAALRGGDPAECAARARAILSSDPAEQGDAAWLAVVMTAACGLYAAGRCDLQEGAARAEAALREGRAQALLERLMELSRG